MERSHALSERAIKKMGLDKEDKKPALDQKPIKEWESADEYWREFVEDRSERNAKWYIKVANIFKYSIGWRTREWWIDTKWYFSNLRTFQPILKTWRSFDYHYQVDLFKFGLEQLAKALDYYGNEEETSRKKRIEAINRLISEINRDYEEELREKLNYRHVHKNTKVTQYSDGSVCFHYDDDDEAEQRTKIFFDELAKERRAHYDKIFHLLVGQEDKEIDREIKKRIAAMSEEEKQSTPENEIYRRIYYDVWDGSGIEGWWD